MQVLSYLWDMIVTLLMKRSTEFINSRDEHRQKLYSKLLCIKILL